ncbi:MAG: hypothetical protein K2Z81_03020 [Cyanobacteria bacterium]|nr:hypothetical protein [Cyanobacteriota bacterium]
MVTNIKRLSRELDGDLRKYYIDWMYKAQSLEPAERSEVEAAIRTVYLTGGELEDPKIIWCDSPMQMVMVPVLIALAARLTPAERDLVAAQMRVGFQWRVKPENWSSLWLQICERVFVDSENGSSENINDSGVRRFPDYSKCRISPGLPGDFIDSIITKQLSGDMASRLGAEFDARIEGEAHEQLDFLLRKRLTPDYWALKNRVAASIPRRNDTNEELTSIFEAVSSAISDPAGKTKSLIGIIKRFFKRSPKPPSGLIAGIWKEELRHSLAMRLSTFYSKLWGPWDTFWLSFYSFPREYIDRSFYTRLSDMQLTAWLAITNGALALEFHSNMCFVCDHPIKTNLDTNGRPHCSDGPAIAFRDGWGLYAWHGIPVPKFVIEEPEKINPREIEREQNVEIRRIMIERYGEGQYLIDSGAKKVHSDKYGTLYRKEIEDDEPLVMVKVINASPEVDGTSKTYFIRVPPGVSTAREAVAWSFGLDESDYKPNLET